MALLKYDLTGQRFTRLVVTRKLPNSLWECLCECGNTHAVQSSALRRGKVKSCGCYYVESRRAVKHGHAANGKLSPTYQSWVGMIKRCTNPGHIRYPFYGGRGITVCERWLKFANFLEDMGERPAGLTLDREDNDGNYEKGNCRWATDSEQNSNKRYRSNG